MLSMSKPVMALPPKRLNSQPPTTAPTMPSRMSTTVPSPVVLTILLAIRPSPHPQQDPHDHRHTTLLIFSLSNRGRLDRLRSFFSLIRGQGRETPYDARGAASPSNLKLKTPRHPSRLKLRRHGSRNGQTIVLCGLRNPGNVSLNGEQTYCSEIRLAVS
jgi:hypothetical protein